MNGFQPKTETKYDAVFGNEVKGVQQSVVTASDTVIEKFLNTGLNIL